MSHRPRRGEVWSLAPVDAEPQSLVLVVDDGRDELFDVWYACLAISPDGEAATRDEPVLRAEDLRIVGAGPNDWRMRTDDEYSARASDLHHRVGVLTTSGRSVLVHYELGFLPEDRFGAAPDTGDGEYLADVAPLVAARLAAVARDRGDDQPGAHAPTEVDRGGPDRLAVINRPVIDGIWPRRLKLAPGLLVVVDLFAGDARPALIADTSLPGRAALAERLTDPSINPLLRRLVAAEARVAARPHGLWVVDAAVAVHGVVAWLETHAADLGPASTLNALADRRAHQALAAVASLPHGVAFSATNRSPERFVRGLSTALGPVADALAARRPDLAKTVEDYRGWVHAAAPELAQLAERRARQVFPLDVRGQDRAFAAHLGPSAATPLPTIAVIDGLLLEQEFLPTARAAVEMELVVDDGPSTRAESLLRATVPLRPSAVNAIESNGIDEPDVAAINNVWVELLAMEIGHAVAASTMRLDLSTGALIGDLRLPGPEVTAASLAVRVTPRPRRILSGEEAVATVFSAPRSLRPGEAEQLARLAAPLGAASDAAPRRLETLAAAMGSRLRLAAQALSDHEPLADAAPSVPSEARGTLSEELIEAALRERLALRAEERRAQGQDPSAAAAREILDHLLG